MQGTEHHESQHSGEVHEAKIVTIDEPDKIRKDAKTIPTPCFPTLIYSAT